MRRILLRSRLFLMATVAAVLVIACAGSADLSDKAAGIGVVTINKSTFDGTMVIKATPGRLYDPNVAGSKSVGSVMLGAEWNSERPDSAVLTMLRRGGSPYEGIYKGIKGIDINIDGTVSSFSTKDINSLYKGGHKAIVQAVFSQGENSVVIPFQILDEMVSAQSCKVRIRTSQGQEESDFSIERAPGGGATAKIPIKKLLVAAKEAREAKN